MIAIEAISDCSFTDCGHISGLCVASTTFRDCASIQFIPSTFTGKGYVKNCDFVHVKSIFCQKTDVENCRFQNLLNDGSYKGMLYLDNCRASDCTFSDIELRNNSYLIFGEKNASVDNCEFTNCQTEREDSNLIYIEPPKKIAKGLFKGALKLAGSAALAAAGAAATIVREAANASGSDVLSDVAGTIQDASFEKIRDMWGGDDATRIDKMCQKIDRMNDDELLAYMEKLVLDMDEGDMEEFSKKVDAFTSEKEDAKARQQFRELLKETTKARGVPGSIDEEAKAKRAEERAETARRNGEQFAKRYEKEKAKFEDEHQ